MIISCIGLESFFLTINLDVFRFKGINVMNQGNFTFLYPKKREK